jgi:hypothetical protein
MAVDPLRFGLPHRNRSLWLYRFIGKVDRVIVLHDRPEHIVFRKPELSNKEIRRQSDYWNALYREGLVTQIIDVENKTAEAVGAEIARILDAVSRHTTPASTIGRGAPVQPETVPRSRLEGHSALFDDQLSEK